MKLPHVSRAVVSEEKITRYLLNRAHPVGRSKAEFFLKHGFSPETWNQLAAAFKRHAEENEAALSETTTYGTRFVVDGLLPTPSGSHLRVRCVWFINSGEDFPRFVTAHPLPKK